jgi:competence protein ComEA
MVKDEAFETTTRGPGCRPGAGGLALYRPQVVISMLVFAILIGGALYAARLPESAPQVVYTALLEEVEDESQDSLQIDVDTASAEELDALPEVGPSTAESIIEYRQNNGQFTSVDEFEEVLGIGPARGSAW